MYGPCGRRVLGLGRRVMGAWLFFWGVQGIHSLRCAGAFVCWLYGAGGLQYIIKWNVWADGTVIVHECGGTRAAVVQVQRDEGAR